MIRSVYLIAIVMCLSVGICGCGKDQGNSSNTAKKDAKAGYGFDIDYTDPDYKDPWEGVSMVDISDYVEISDISYESGEVKYSVKQVKEFDLVPLWTKMYAGNFGRIEVQNSGRWEDVRKHIRYENEMVNNAEPGVLITEDGTEVRDSSLGYVLPQGHYKYCAPISIGKDDRGVTVDSNYYVEFEFDVTE